MKMRSVIPMRIAKYGYIGLSAFFCVLGLLFIVRTAVTEKLLLTLLGAGLTVFGIIKVIGYLSKDLYRLAFQYDLELGILLLLLGSIALIYPMKARSFMTVAVGISVLIDSLFKIRITGDARTFGIRQWRMVRIVSVVTAVTGFLLMLDPWHSTGMLPVILGLALITEGVLNLIVVISMVKISKSQYPDDVETKFKCNST